MNVVNFCPECSGMLKVKKEEDQCLLICRCGYKKEFEPEKLESIKNIESKKREPYYLKLKYRRGF